MCVFCSGNDKQSVNSQGMDRLWDLSCSKWSRTWTAHPSPHPSLVSLATARKTEDNMLALLERSDRLI